MAQPSLAARIRKGLFTHEDPFNVHKVLGLSCLLSFLYRAARVGASDMGFSASWQTAATLLVHLALSTSSLVFRIPKKRIVEGSRIWPEYRLHSIVFACRSLACMAVVWLEARGGASEPQYLANAAIVIGTMAAADYSTWHVGEASRSSTIQDLHAPAAMRYFFSVMQFHATTGCLIGIRRYSTQFVYVWIIQFTAFLLTLQRKNLTSHYPLLWVYGVMLTFGLVVSTTEHMRFGAFAMAQAISNFSAVGRLGLRCPKYLLWTLMAVVVHFARKTTLLDPDPAWAAYAFVWPYLWAASVAGVLVVGARKLSRPSATPNEVKLAAKAA